MGTLVGMGTEMGTSRIDDRGRVTLPQELRDALALAPGDVVTVEKAADGVVLRRMRSKKELWRKLRGVITEKNAVGKLDPLELKRLFRASD